MSETRYERTPDGKWKHFVVGNKIETSGWQPAKDSKALEIAYQLGLQSHPAPTPDLLTDEEIVAKEREWEGRFKNYKLEKGVKAEGFYSFIAQAQLSKLQQARPTTEPFTRWIIECSQPKYGERHFWDGIDWTDSAQDTLQFPTKLRAEAYIVHVAGYGEWFHREVYPVEHTWVSLLPDEQAIRQDSFTLKDLQAAIHNWNGEKFPTAPSHLALLKIGEEYGELNSHFIGRVEQRVGKAPVDYQAGLEDAVGDVCISLCVFCEREHLDMASIVEKVWTEVSKRSFVMVKALASLESKGGTK